MSAQPEFGFAQLITELVRGLADAVADRPGETEAQRFARHQAAIFSVMAFLPRDAMETVVAGECVLFDHLLRDATHDLLCSEAEPVKRRIRSQLTAIGRLFLKHLEQFRLLQKRQGQQKVVSPDAAPARNAEAAAFRPAEGSSSADGEAAGSQPESVAVKEAGPLQQFQNRRMRRTQQFKKSAKGLPRSARPGPEVLALGPAVRL
jgi:hypothetical protein